MDLPMIALKLTREKELEALRGLARLLLKCLTNDRKGAGYCVVDDQNPAETLYTGARGHCLAYIEGVKQAKSFENADRLRACVYTPHLCVCVDTPSRCIVIPETRFGETFVPRGGWEKQEGRAETEKEHTDE